MSDLVDLYQMRARVQPGLLAALPMAVTLGVVTGAKRDLSSAALAFAGTMGVTYFVAQLVRDRGRGLEPELWHSWGGAPTSQLLRGSEEEAQATRERRWAVMGKLMPNLNRDGTAEGPPDADIDLYVGHLRERTRGQDDFPLVAAENAGYGFRRNMYGLRTLGIALAAAATTIALASLIYEAANHHGHQVPVLVGVTAVDALSLVAWIFIVRSGWVRQQGFAYARALLGAAENLAPSGD